MRKLAREAVIFILLTPLLFVIGGFIYLYHDAHKPVVPPIDYIGLAKQFGGTTTPPVPQSQFDMSKAKPLPCKDGDKDIEDGRLLWDCKNGVRTPPNNPYEAYGGYEIPSKPLDLSEFGGTVVQPLDLSAGLIPKPKPTSELLGNALLFGLWGFPAGFALWVFYRIVFFAVKG